MFLGSSRLQPPASGGPLLAAQDWTPGFSPLQISGLVAWFDFSRSDTLWQDVGRTSPVTADGQTIKGVTDLSANGNHLSEATNPPTYKVGIQNGYSAALYNGTTSVLSRAAFAGFNGLQNWSMYVVCSPPNDANQWVIASYGTFASNNSFYLLRKTNKTADVFNRPGAVTSDWFDGSATFFGANVLSTTFDGTLASAETKLWLNGVQTSQGAATDGDSSAAMPVATFYLGNSSDGSQKFSNHILEFLIYNTTHSAGVRAGVEAGLKKKWGTP